MALSGVVSRIAWVDLTARSVTYERPSDETYAQFLGGYGLGAYYLFKRQRPGLDPLGVGATLGFVTGVLTGTPAITGNRFVVVGKSPKTGGWGDANCGGRFGPALKRAGLDALFVTGIAAQPAYLQVEQGNVTVRDATRYWGMLTSETEDALHSEHGKDAAVATIGPAGERVRALACIINDKGRAAGRSGLGMVMGAKRLKAVVAAGRSDIPLARKDDFVALRRRLIAEYCTADNPFWAAFHDFGTPVVFGPNVEIGDTPVRNWAGWYEELPSYANLGAEAVRAIQKRRYGCWACPISCGGHVVIPEGPYAGEGHKPEYETLGAFGTACLNDNLEAVCHLNNLCNEYGMDTISTGATLAFAMECYEHGLLSDAQLDGCGLEWGDHAGMVRVTERIARGEGSTADILGDGTAKAVQRLGPKTAQFAMACGGEELGMHDPRCSSGLAASYVADATPGRHTQAHEGWVESLCCPSDYEPLAGLLGCDDYMARGEAHKWVSDYNHALSQAGLCEFSLNLLPSSLLPTYLTLATGREFTMDAVLEAGERAANLRIAFNLREGLRNRDVYRLPPRVLGEPPLAGGATKGVTVLDNEQQLRGYYSAMGWNPETGVPLRETLERLSLGFASDVAE